MESTDSSAGSQLPPGFRFHPTDEELVVHYLKKKEAAAPLPVSIIADVDIYKFDPWELPGKAVFGEQEWYFFTPRDRKYPNGARPNRAATSGYWKATGTDKPVLTSGGTQKVGVKKALVFYCGKPPKGIKTNWIMHEYRLADNKPNPRPPICDISNKKGSLRLDDWVLCRIYKKNNAQRPVDQERDDVHGMIGAMIPHSLLIPAGHHKFLEHDHSLLYQGNNSHNLGLSPSGATLAQHPGFCWMSDASASNENPATTRRFLGGGRSSEEGTTTEDSPMAAVLNQMPQTPLGEGVFGQQGYHQVLGINWY